MKNPLIHKGIAAIIALAFIGGMNNLYGQTVGNPGPDFEASLQGGGTFKLSDQRGKVVFVFLFGNGCPSCKAVGPTIESDVNQVFGENEAFRAIGLDTWNTSSSEISVAGFRNATGITFPLAVMAGSIAADYATTYDRLMVIDQEGILVHKGILVAKNDVANAISAIEQSLGVTGLEAVAGTGNGLKVFPLPASDVVHFESDRPIRGVRIFNAAGQMVLQESSGTDPQVRHAVPVGRLEEGLYFYSVQTDGPDRTGKLFIQR